MSQPKHQPAGAIRPENEPDLCPELTSASWPPKQQFRFALLWCRTAAFLVAFIIMIVAVVVAVPAQLYPNTTDYHSPEVDCLRIVSSASSLERFPLPYPVDLRAHEDILNLNEFPNLEMLTRLNRTHTAVCSTLATTTQELVRYISDATKIYHPFPRGYTTYAFYVDTLFVSEQLRLATSLVNNLAEAYDTLQRDYYALMDTTNEAFKQRQLSGTTKFLAYAQPGGLAQRLGVFDAHKAYLTPLEKNALNADKVLSGVVALTRERQRVMEIKRVVREVDRILQLLASVVRDTKTSSHHHNMKADKGRASVQKKLKEWYEQHIIHNRQLNENWIELLASVDREEKEEVLGMKISTEWCPR